MKKVFELIGKKRNIWILMVFILVMITLVSRSTYAIYNSNYKTEELTYAGGLLQITSEFSGGSIELADLQPKEDEEGISSTSYIYTITNTETVPYKFNSLMIESSSSKFDSFYVKVQENDLMSRSVRSAKILLL